MSRRAFTLIELLIVLGIIGLLIGLLLPAVQKIREIALRTQASSQLQQLSLATQSYHATTRTLPNYVDPLAGDINLLGITTTFTKLLPHLEQESLYQELVKNGPTATLTTVKVFRNPMDTTADDGRALTSWVANGLLLLRNGVALPSATPDGTSNTLLLTERLSGCGPWPTTYNGWGNNITTSPAPLGGYLAAAVLTDSTPPQLAPSGVAACVPGRASTRFSTGILVTMCDGSVRFVARGGPDASATGGLTNWAAVLNPADGQMPGSEW